MPESVSILIPTHNRCDLLARALESLRALQVPADTTVEVIVIANACTDPTRAVVEASAAQMPFPTRVVDEPQLGLNRARNRGLAEARGAIVAFLDDDVWVEPGWLKGLLDVFHGQPADLVAGVVTLWWEVVQRPAWMTSRSEHLLSCVNYGAEVIELTQPGQAVGANLAFRRTTVDRAGPFNITLDRAGDYPLGGGDTGFIARALRAGCRMFYAPQAAVRHWVAPHRITRKYLASVAFGNGLAVAFLKPPTSVLRSRILFARYFTLACVYGVVQYAVMAIGMERAAINMQIRRMASRGRYIGAFRWLYRGSPLGKVRPGVVQPTDPPPASDRSACDAPAPQKS